MATTALFVVSGIVIYAIAYWLYSRWYDKKIFEANPKATTPAHMYMDGIEFFPTSKYVLFGFQFKGIAAIGPITGPVVAITFGWLPCLLWILLGNFFIGWLQDYSAIMISVKMEGKSFGPIAYELISPRARTLISGFIVLYLLFVIGAFTNACAGLLMKIGQAALPIFIVAVMGVFTGFALYKLKANIILVTVIDLVITVGILIASVVFKLTTDLTPIFGAYTFDVWLWLAMIFCILGAALPIWSYLQPVNYVAFYLCYFGVIAIVIAALHPAAVIQAPVFTSFLGTGPAPWWPKVLWPTMFVTIACGAISGWHSLVGSTATAKQLDIETDALPVGAGSMLSEGIQALSALAAAAVIPFAELVKLGGPARWSTGVDILLSNVGIPSPFGSVFGAVLFVLFALTTLQLAYMFLRLATVEISGPFRPLFENRWIGVIVWSIVVYIMVRTGTFIYLFLSFGAANQMMAGLALVLITVYAISRKKPAIFSGGPAIFMSATCLAAIIWNVISFGIITGDKAAVGDVAGAAGHAFASLMNIALLLLAILTIWEGVKAVRRWRAAPVPEEG